MAPAPAPITPLSHLTTNDRVLALVKPLCHEGVRILDVGAGHGFFSARVSDYLRSTVGIDPGESLAACDTAPHLFACEGIRCSAIGQPGILPYADATFDVVCSIEVVEHVEDQFAFCREIMRVLKPGGTAVITTPNILNMNSRWRTLGTGFPVLFEPLPLDRVDAVHTSGHIHPISYYYLAFALRRAGASTVQATYDRRKRSAMALSVLLGPLIFVRSALLRRWLKKRRPDVLRQNAELLDECSSLGMLWSRSVIAVAVR